MEKKKRSAAQLRQARKAVDREEAAADLDEAIKEERAERKRLNDLRKEIDKPDDPTNWLMVLGLVIAFILYRIFFA